MDFFERAHVLKKQSSKKESKADEIMKKQLKQMLYGYKKSDNELIKSSANVNNDHVDNRGFDDSTSVSGFSDLNLTNSDNDAETSRTTIPKELDDSISVHSIDNSQSSSVKDIEDLSQNSSNFEQYMDDSESISEYKDGIESLSEDIEFSEDSIASSDNISLIEAFDDTSKTGSIDSDTEFDPDGSLATKILERLSEKELFNIKSEKRKIENVIKKKSKSKIRKQNVKDNQAENTESLESTDTVDSESTNQSSAFISITATEVPNESLSEILGDYRHPTVRNLPSEKQNVVYSTNSSGIFATEDTEILEDVSSLVPELGDDEVLDVDLDSSSVMPVDESITAYDTIQSESDRESSTEDFDSSVKVYYGNNCCVFVLKHPTELYVNGKVKLQTLGGTIEVFGYILKNEVELYAPNSYYAHCVKTVENINAYYGLFGKLKSAGLTIVEAEEIVTTVGEYDGVISMSPLTDRKIDFVENNFTSDLFTKPSKNIDSHLRAVSLKLGCSLYLKRPWRYFEENEMWSEALACGLNENSKGIVCGGKGLGKSTFLRYYVNKMLEYGPVLVVDLDPGQAEFTVAGNVSATVVTQPLIGPNFTHLKRPEIMLNIGLINPMDNIIRYAAAVSELIGQCQRNPAYRSMRWVINTMGMCNHTGLKLITLAILHAQPTFLLQIDTKIAKKRFDCHLQSYNITQLYHEEFKNDRLFRNIQFPEYLEYNFILAQHVQGSDKHNTALPPKDERYLNFLAYFGELLYVHKGMDLLGIVPYEVKLSDVNIITNVKVAAEAVAKVLNGKIVALCELGASDKGKVFTLDDKPLLCHGHGLVRGVDFEKETLYVITVVEAARLAAVDALVYADWAPELRGQERALPPATAVPYRSTTVPQHKRLMLSPRRRFNPLQLLKMSRNT